jgi:alcohol dehydrogenase class IV
MTPHAIPRATAPTRRLGRMTPASFTWRDGERTVAFGRGCLERAVELLGGPGFTLLTTERAAAMAPAVAGAAGAVHHVGPGLVEDLAGDLLDAVAGDRLVALGGGRVVDVTKALAAARGVRAMAVPTTLSGAEMTRSHRIARGVEGTAQARPSVVVHDPALAASQPEAELAASALNALGHAVEAPCTVRANPVSTLAAHEAARLLHAGFARAGEPDRDTLALGALLAGYALDSTGLGLHHVLAQTLVREAGIGHGHANAALLPHTIGALARRNPDAHDALTAAVGEDPAAAAAAIAARAGATRLADLGVDPAVLGRAANVAAERAQLDNTPPRATAAEILSIYEAAL